MTTMTRRRALRTAAPIAGLLAAALLTYAASGAAFTATTTSPDSNWAAGQVVLTNNTGAGDSFVVNGAARFSASGIGPGDTDVRCITVRSDGGFAGNLKAYVQNVGGTGLQNRIQLSVRRAVLPTGTGAGTTIPADCTGYPTTSTNLGAQFLTGLPTSYAAAPSPLAVPSGVVSNVAYRITWTFVSTGSTAGDNALQGTNAAADFLWELQ